MNARPTIIGTILPHSHPINIPLAVSNLLQKSSKTGKLMKFFLEVFIMTVIGVFPVETIYLEGSYKKPMSAFSYISFFPLDF